MAENHFDFKQFRINQEKAAFRVGTDSVLLGAWTDLRGVSTVLDVGTGTGVLALMVAQRSTARIVAIEPDSLSAGEAEANIAMSRWKDRITIIETSLQEYLYKTAERYDLIISNPPYFSGSLANPDPRSAGARHALTLSGEELISASGSLLTEKGRLSIVLPYAEGNLFIATASGYGLYCNRMTRVKPLPGSPVKRLLMEFGRTKEELVSDYLIIGKGERHNYTEEYTRLTRDFYLEF
ncbi:MAG: methyltransferase [Bacteroidales bacterium]